MPFPTAPRQPFVGLVLAAVCGIMAADLVPGAWQSVPVLLIVAGVLALLLLVRPILPATFLFVSFAFYLLHGFQVADTSGQWLKQRLGERPRPVRVTGAVISEPKPAAGGTASFLFRLRTLELEGKKEETSAVVLVRWRGAAVFGDELQLFGQAEPIDPPRNPGEFDMRSYLARRDVYRQLFVRYAEDGVLLRHDGGNPILRAAQQSRVKIQHIICRDLDDAPDVQTFLSGLVLGLRHQAPEDIEEPFQQTGTLHLFAVAGLHVGIVAQLLWILAAMARLPRKLAAGLTIPAVLFYAAVTGLHISSMRAAIMASVFLAGVFFERKVLALNSLAAAAFLLLAWNTQELFSTGFQLSFAVVGTIVLINEPLAQRFARWTAPDPFLPRNLVRGSRKAAHLGLLALGRASSVSLAAWIGSLVLILWYFHLVTPIALFANLAVVPVAFCILAAALLSLLTSPLVPGISLIFNNANWLMTRVVIALVHLFAQFPAGHHYRAHPAWPDGALARINVLDLGAGATAHLRAGSANWLFDCGSDRDYERTVREYLHTVGLNELSGLLLSHGDAQHIGATPRLLAECRPGLILDSPLPNRSIVHRRLRDQFGQTGINVKSLGAGTSIVLAPAVIAHVLYPPRLSLSSLVDDQCLVVRVDVGDRDRVLFMSDSGTVTEQALLRSGGDLRADILIKGQHRSSASGSAALLDAVHPRLIISSSRDFPENERIKDEWVDELKRRQIHLFRQDQTGAVQLNFWPDRWEGRAYVTGETFRSSSR